MKSKALLCLCVVLLCSIVPAGLPVATEPVSSKKTWAAIKSLKSIGASLALAGASAGGGGMGSQCEQKISTVIGA